MVDKVAARMQEKFGMDRPMGGRHPAVFALRRQRHALPSTADAIEVQAELGMMLSPLKGMVEQEIRRKLDEHFA